MVYSIRTKNLFDPERPDGFKVSRSKIDLFLECPRCFYMDTRLGIKRPDTYPLTLNVAVDHLLKKEFDIHRSLKQAHPMMKQYKIDALPYDGKEINTWREVDFGRGGVHHIHSKTKLDVYGAVDDVWINPNGELIVVDYKATSKKDTPTLEGDLGNQYKRQMEVYQWLLKQNGFKVSDVGYFVYVNGRKDLEAFDGKLEFNVNILPCVGDSSWIEETLVNIKDCLLGSLPKSSPTCDYCDYRKASVLAASKYLEEKPAKNTKKSDDQAETLF